MPFVKMWQLAITYNNQYGMPFVKTWQFVISITYNIQYKTRQTLHFLIYKVNLKVMTSDKTFFFKVLDMYLQKVYIVKFFGNLKRFSFWSFCNVHAFRPLGQIPCALVAFSPAIDTRTVALYRINTAKRNNNNNNKYSKHENISRFSNAI